MAAFRILEYQTEARQKPYPEWRASLKDRIAAALIKTHVTRMELGHFGKHRFVGDGVWELKIAYGPGYRVYFMHDAGRLIILLCGGDKGSQDRDIERARAYAADYWRRK